MESTGPVVGAVIGGPSWASPPTRYGPPPVTGFMENAFQRFLLLPARPRQGFVALRYGTDTPRRRALTRVPAGNTMARKAVSFLEWSHALGPGRLLR